MKKTSFAERRVVELYNARASVYAKRALCAMIGTFVVCGAIALFYALR